MARLAILLCKIAQCAMLDLAMIWHCSSPCNPSMLFREVVNMLSQILQLILRGIPLLRAVAQVLNAAVSLLVSIAKANALLRAAGTY